MNRPRCFRWIYDMLNHIIQGQETIMSLLDDAVAELAVVKQDAADTKARVDAGTVALTDQIAALQAQIAAGGFTPAQTAVLTAMVADLTGVHATLAGISAPPVP